MQRLSRDISISIDRFGMERHNYAIPVFSINAFYRWPSRNGLGRFVDNGIYTRMLTVHVLSQMEYVKR